MPLPADLPALNAVLRCAVASLVGLSMTVAAADATPKPTPRPKADAPKPATTPGTLPSPAAPAPIAKPADTPLPPPESSAPSALGPDGLRVQGELRLSGGSLTVGAAAIALDRLVSLDAPGALPRWIDQGVVLSDGEVLRGCARSFQGGKLAFASDTLGEREFPAEAIAAIILSAVPTADPLMGGGDPGALLANGDRVGGALAFINEHEAGIDNGRRVVKVPRANARMVMLRPPTRAKNAPTWLTLATGDRVSGVLGALGADGIELTSPQLGQLKLPISSLRLAWSVAPALQALEALPGKASSTPEFDEAFPVLIGHGNEGALLAAGPRRWPHGLTLHSGLAMTWEVPNGWSSLVGEVGLAGDGAALCRITLDGKEAWSHPLTTPGASAPFSLPLQGAHELRISVEPPSGGDTAGGRVVWGCPTLVK
jgi:hypothetical protein